MTPVSDVEAAILGKLADIAQHQAVNTERLIANTDRLAAVVERVDEHLTRMDAERDKAVAGIKQHMEWSTWKAFGAALVIFMLADIAGAALKKFIPFLKP